jgi:hypothetical protein
VHRLLNNHSVQPTTGRRLDTDWTRQLHRLRSVRQHAAVRVAVRVATGPLATMICDGLQTRGATGAAEGAERLNLPQHHHGGEHADQRPRWRIHVDEIFYSGPSAVDDTCVRRSRASGSKKPQVTAVA